MTFTRNRTTRLRNERDRALDDQRVMTIPQWAEVNGFSIWTAQRLIKAGKAPPITQISDRRIGITVANNRKWQAVAGAVMNHVPHKRELRRWRRRSSAGIFKIKQVCRP